MTGQPSIWWLGDDVVVLRGESARRAYAAMTLAVRHARRNARHNGVPLPEDVVQDLHVLRQAADRARADTKPAGFASTSAEVAQPTGVAAWGEDDLVDVKEVARMLNVSRPYARRLCWTFVSHRFVGREHRVSAAEVEAYAAARREKRSA